MNLFGLNWISVWSVNIFQNQYNSVQLVFLVQTRYKPRDHVVTQPIIKIEIWYQKAEKDLIGVWHNENLLQGTNTIGMTWTMWEWFLRSSVLERIEFDLSKINWFRGIIWLHSNNVGALRHVSIMSHFYHTSFGFLGSYLYLDYGSHDHMITKFTSLI